MVLQENFRGRHRPARSASMMVSIHGWQGSKRREDTRNLWKIKGWKGELGHAPVRCIEIEVFEVWEEPGYAKYTQKLNRITVR